MKLTLLTIGILGVAVLLLSVRIILSRKHEFLHCDHHHPRK